MRTDLRKKNDPKLMEELRRTIDIAVRLKAVMQRKGLRRARCVCPRCKDFIWARLAGPKDHLHMQCKGECKMLFME